MMMVVNFCINYSYSAMEHPPPGGVEVGQHNIKYIGDKEEL